MIINGKYIKIVLLLKKYEVFVNEIKEKERGSYE